MDSNVLWRWINVTVAMVCSAGIVLVFTWVNSKSYERHIQQEHEIQQAADDIARIRLEIERTTTTQLRNTIEKAIKEFRSDRHSGTDQTEFVDALMKSNPGLKDPRE